MVTSFAKTELFQIVGRWAGLDQDDDGDVDWADAAEILKKSSRHLSARLRGNKDSHRQSNVKAPKKNYKKTLSEIEANLETTLKDMQV